MKSLTRFIVLAVVLVGLALATGVAYAGQIDQGIGNMLRLVQGTAPEPLLESNVEQKSGMIDEVGDINIIGVVTSITTDTLVVSDIEMAVTADTVFEDEVAAGDFVKVVAFYADDTTLTARRVALYEDDFDEEYVTLVGNVTSITSDTLTVSDVAIAINEDTEFLDEVAVGDQVKVKAFFTDEGILTAFKVALVGGNDHDDEVTIIGVLTEITTDTLVVSDTVIAVTPQTEFEDEVVVGDMVKVRAFYADDGTLTARKVALVEDDHEDEVTIIGLLTEITTDTLVVSDTVIAVTPQTVFEDEVAVGDMVKVRAFYADDGTLTARRVALFDGDDDGKPGFGHGTKVFITGLVDSFSSDSIVVSGVPISVTAETKIQGDIQVGDTVRVHAFLAEDGSLTAWKIKLLPDSVSNPGNGDKMMVIHGLVEELTSDTIVVSGIWLPLSAETKMDSGISVGDRVKVIASTEGGTVTVLKVILQGKGGNDSGDSGGAGKGNREDRTNPGNGGGNDKGNGNDNNGGNGQGNGNGNNGGNDQGNGNNQGGGNDKGGLKDKGNGNDKGGGKHTDKGGGKGK